MLQLFLSFFFFWYVVPQTPAIKELQVRTRSWPT